MSTTKHREKRSLFLTYVVAGPLISLMIVPIVIADIFLEIYHRICFPIYGIPYGKKWGQLLYKYGNCPHNLFTSQEWEDTPSPQLIRPERP